jgi:hypothetical protein
MARLFTTGMECGDVLDFDGGRSAAAHSTTVAKTGTYSVRVGNGYARRLVSPSPNNEIYMRAWTHIVAVGTGNPILAAYLSDGNSVQLYWNDVSKKLELRRHTTMVADLVGGTRFNEWRMYELYAKIAEAPDGILTLRIDGVQALTFTGDTQAGSVSEIIYVSFGGSANYTYFDDVAVNDTSGAADNSWCGDGRVIAIKPNAAGDVDDFTPSAGDNYECVDEVPYNTTDYNESATDGHLDLFNLEACGLSGVDILGVDVKWMALKTVANGDQQRAVIKTGGTEYDGSDQGFDTTYTRLIETWRTNPDTAVAWTTADLDALQAGYENRAA